MMGRKDYKCTDMVCPFGYRYGEKDTGSIEKGELTGFNSAYL